MWTMLEDRLKARLRSDPGIRSKVKQVERDVADGTMTPAVAAEAIVTLLKD
jgi:LAO/AO transport system kinase